MQLFQEDDLQEGLLENTSCLGSEKLADVLQVISGTTTGGLYIWAEGLVEALICRPRDLPCHAGCVQAVVYDSSSRCLLSGGHDGYACASVPQILDPP